MKPIKIFIVLLFYLICNAASAQDLRTLDTKIADLLAKIPVSNFEYRDSLAEETFNLGNEGLIKLCSMVLPPGSGDDTRARFAIESLSKYLSTEVPSGNTQLWERLCINFVIQSSDKHVKSFFIRQLEWTGASATVDALSSYLSDEFLCNPSISAMKRADSGKAGMVFAASLSNLNGTPKTEVVRAIGDLKVVSANGVLLEMLTLENEASLQRNILRALASIGSPDSYKSLLNAAKVTGYEPEHTGATMALAEYARELGQNGNTEISNNICLQLMKKCKSASQVQFKSFALKVYSDNTEIEDAVHLLVSTMKDENISYRMSVINYAISKDSPSGPWVEELAKTKNPVVQAEIIFLLGSIKDKPTLTTFTKYLNAPDAMVRIEAIGAIASIGGSAAADIMVTHMIQHPAEPDLSAARSAILSIASTKDIKPFISKISGYPDPVKIVFMELLAEKGNPDFFNILMEFAGSEAQDVSLSALKGLKNVALEENMGELMRLLGEDMDALSTAEVQQAIISVIEMTADKNKYRDLLFSQVEQEEDMIKYIPVLASLAGNKCLEAIIAIYNDSQGESKGLALDALSNWPDGAALSKLYDIYENTGSESALNGYIIQVNKSNPTPDQKLLLLRKIFPLTKNADQRNKVIDACSSIRTFQSFMFVSGFINEEALQQSSASAAVQIALPTSGRDNGLYGDYVKDFLIKAKEIIAGPESTYIKNNIEIYLESMSDERGFVSIFNGEDFSGWQGLVEDPISRAKMDKEELESKQAEANNLMLLNWHIQDGILVFRGSGYDNICTIKEYQDFEMTVDWRIGKNGDSGIYLRGSPQVQIWDPWRDKPGAEAGSGGLFNNKKNPDKPMHLADNDIMDWNTFRITMIGDRVSVFLNGILVVDNVVLENYWDRSIPIFPVGPIELQAHGSDIAFRDIYVREL
jgi:HEAT repeat protein